MIAHPFDYARPATLAEALDPLAAKGKLALSPLGVRNIDMTMTPEKARKLIHQGASA